jgi:hypothetical protein
MLPLYLGDDSLYGTTPYEELRMPGHGRVLVAARRYLSRDHGFTRNDLSETSSLAILRWHLDAHSLPIHQTSRTPSLGHSWMVFIVSVAGGVNHDP